jgi:osmotically-inducible protein OsmY
MAALFLTSVSVFASEADDRIVSSAKQSYVFKTYLNDDEIQIASKNGIVTLTGTVSEEAHKSLAKETVSSLPGVTSVDNKLAIKGKNTMSKKIEAVGDSIDDASITAMVKTTLLYHRSTSALNTTVESKEGVVTLGGKAKTASEKDLAAKLVSDVHGVKSVINTMTIE